MQPLIERARLIEAQALFWFRFASAWTVGDLVGGYDAEILAWLGVARPLRMNAGIFG
jgi:hypothetical protein